MTSDVVFFLDVDNTLLDNDRVLADLRREVQAAVGESGLARYWTHFESMRDEVGYADYLGALQRYRSELERAGGDGQALFAISKFLIDYPFADRVFDRAFELIEHLGRFGETVLLSDGDCAFQPRKLQQSGLWEAVAGRALIYIHKETMLDDIARRYPARHYVMADDKLRILAAMKPIWGDRLTTVFPRQGQYAHDEKAIAGLEPADITVERIGDVIDLDIQRLLR